MIVVIDTNVLVAGLVAEGLCRVILEEYIPEIDVVCSEVLMDELTEKLESKFGLQEEDLPILKLYRAHARWVEPEPHLKQLCRDEDDDWVIATAMAGDAEYIITGDKDLLELESVGSAKIVSPREFLSQNS